MKKSIKYIIVLWLVAILLPFQLHISSILILGTGLNEVAFGVTAVIVTVVAIVMSLIVASMNRHDTD